MKSINSIGKTQTHRIWTKIKANYMLYLFLLPAAIYLLLFEYIPIYGIQIAFKNFSSSKGIWNSPWVGLKHFYTFFTSFRFTALFQNTLTLSLYSLIVGFPMPIILAIMLNYLKSEKLKKFTQTITYAPHFISTVVLVGMLTMFFSPQSGFVNTFIEMLGFNRIHFFGESRYFKHLYVWSEVWQRSGWNSIIYIAALSGVNYELYEAAIIDGATKLRRIWHIDIPSILPTAIILLILNMGSIMNVGFEKVLLMQNDIILNVAEVISTYTYKIGVLQAEYSYSTAIGLFNNLINFLLLVIMNSISRKVSNVSLW